MLIIVTRFKNIMANPTLVKAYCCPEFDHEKWQEKSIELSEKLFLKDHVTKLFHIPMDYELVMEKDFKIIEAAGAVPESPLVITDEKSPWESDVYIEIGKEIPNVHSEIISGTFLTKVFEGPYKDMDKFLNEMKAYVRKQGKEPKKLFAYNTYCHKCSKLYGKNYTVMLAMV